MPTIRADSGRVGGSEKHNEHRARDSGEKDR